MEKPQHICQVAFSCLDGKAMQQWYQELFGFLDAGNTVFGGPSTTRVQGLPGVWERCRWLIDSQHYFQLEFFQFWRPESKPRPSDWSPADIGYNMLGLWVADFDQCLEHLAEKGVNPLTEPLGEPGQRAVCVKDPEGNLVEILEQDVFTDAARLARPEVPVTARRMTVSVPDLERAQKAWVEGLGLSVIEAPHDYQDARTALWGLPDAKAQRSVLSGENFIVELLQYVDPEPKPRPVGYRICDQGFMNIALGFKQAHEFDQHFQRSLANNYTANGEPLDIGMFRVMYVNDSDNFSVELLHARPALWSLSGFNPRKAYLAFEEWIDAPKEAVWAVVTDHANMASWTPFKGELTTSSTSDDKNGLGAVRRLTGRGAPILEEVVDYQPSHSYTYRLTAGAPMKNHRGDILLTDEAGGTRVRWAISFESPIPLLAPVLKTVMTHWFDGALTKLKNQIERPQRPTGLKGWREHYYNKTVFISGGSSGIGLAMAQQLASYGANIAIFARNQERLDEAREAITSKALVEQQTCHAYSVDISNSAQLASVLEEAVNQLGVPDIVISSAGAAVAKPFATHSIEDFKHNIDVNTLGTIDFVHRLYQKMLSNNAGGQIAIMGSLAGLVPNWGYAAYGTSKAALQSFADVLEMESEGTGISLSLLDPPEVATPMISAEAANSATPRPTRVLKDLLGTAEVDKMAQSSLRSIAKKQRRIVFGARAKFIVTLNRIAPGLVRQSTRVLAKLIH